MTTPISDTTLAQIRRHGLTAADKKRIAAEQDGCALCGRIEPGRKGWVIDHDRSCCPGDASCLDCRRAVLCQWCNNALGYALDNATVLRRMADYLELGTRMHPSQVWRRDQFTDQLTDQVTDSPIDSVDRLSQAAPTKRTDGTDEEITTGRDQSFTSVPRARISNDHEVLAETAALRASHPLTPSRPATSSAATDPAEPTR